MNTHLLAKTLLVALFFFFSVTAKAKCYIGLAEVALRIKDINTKQDYRLLSKPYIDGSVEKHLTSSSQEIQFGCYLNGSWAVEAGYIPQARFGTTSYFRLDASKVDTHGLPIDVGQIVDLVPTAKLSREGFGSVKSLSVLWYGGDTSDTWRPFLRVKYMQAHAEGRGDLSFPCQIEGKKGECLVGVRTWKSARAVAPNLGLSYAKENIQIGIEAPYYGPKLYGIALEIKVFFW